MNPAEGETIYRQVKSVVDEKLDAGGIYSDAELRELIEQQAFASDEQTGVYLTASRKTCLVDRVFHSYRGYDALQPLLDDPAVTEIMINGYRDIFVERGGVTKPSGVQFESAEKLDDVIQTIVAKVNRVVNESSPIVDARLPDGSRVHVVLPPVSLRGATMTIRKFPERPMTMQDLIAKGTLPAEAASLLQTLVHAKYNLFIGGGTGAGKTTLLNALAQTIPADERIVTIEDSAELQIVGIPNVASLETRNANTEGKGEITMRQLIRASLRMRPNRIVVGEVRGGEAFDMLQAMNTGHDGSLSSGHGNSTRDMLSRLETMVLGAVPLPVEVIRSQMASAIDLMIHVSRMRDKSRKVTEISEIAGIRGGEIALHPLYRWQEDEAGASGALLPTGNRLLGRTKLAMAGVRIESVSL
ncbi:CpaF family protein [Paenibacillus cymbidii]|uniref:CpaF family protein n=1 Tax=Paenibacillus cymbidii TaxID=1639034 RepID=UPI0010810396|nr:CpaF family protein [Paenibacillus cymbidii]